MPSKMLFYKHLKDYLKFFCKKYKTFVAVSSDSHTPFEVGHFEYAAALLEKENFPEEQVANRDAARFTEYLKKLK